MDAITYAKKNKIPIKNIPPSNLKTGIITAFLLRKSRERTSVKSQAISNTVSSLYQSVSTYADADCSRITYTSPYDGTDFLSYANAQSNILDKLLLLNPKQIGIINEYMECVFDYGNQVHYLTAKHNIVPVFTKEEDIGIPTQTSLDSNKIGFADSLFNSKNKNIYSYGDLNLNNMVFSSVLSSFRITDYEQQFLYKSPAPCKYFESSSFYSMPFTKPITEQTGALAVPGEEVQLIRSSDTGSSDGFENPFDDIDYSEDFAYYDEFSNYQIDSVQSPFFVSLDGSIFNEKLQIDVTNPLWKANTVKIEKDNHYNSFGSDISYKPTEDAMSLLDTAMTRIYSWKSCLVVFEKENKGNSNLFNSSYEYVLLVGLKTRKYKITDKIDKLFYIHVGDNYINSDKFSKKDIFLLTSSLKTMLKTYNADKVHFFDLSAHSGGNICPNGLLFGIDTEISNQIVNFVNKRDNLFVKLNDTIENIYELFEQI
jgi:hypothetical protein